MNPYLAVISEQKQSQTAMVTNWVCCYYVCAYLQFLLHIESLLLFLREEFSEGESHPLPQQIHTNPLRMATLLKHSALTLNGQHQMIKLGHYVMIMTGVAWRMSI